MKNRPTFTLIMAVSLILTNYLSFAQTAEELLPKAIQLEEVKGELEKAIEVYQTIVTGFPDNKPVATKAQLHIGLCYEKLGNAAARKAYERVVRDYPDQTEMVTMAKAKLATLGGSGGIGGGGGLVTRRILTDASGVDGVLTSDGKYIMDMDQETGDVIRFEIASRQTSRIADKAALRVNGIIVEDHMFSHDGTKIVCSYICDSDSTDLVFTHLDGSGLHQLYTRKKGYVDPLDWSPDAGSILILRNNDDTNELLLISGVNGSERLLKSYTSGRFDFQNACFSPEGQFIAFSMVRTGNPTHGDVFLMTADGRNEIVVAGHPAEDRFIRWTPDGKYIVFLSDRSGTRDIWTVRITGGKQQGEPELLKKDFGRDSEVLGFAPDGSLFYKTYIRTGGLYIGAIDLETGKILVPPAPVKTRYNDPPDQLTWSPDGNKLLYIPRMGNNFRENNILTIRYTATGEERILSPRLRYVNQISWAPDGRSIIALGIAETERGIFRIDAETSGITKLAGVNHFAPHLSPDGKTLVFNKGGGPTLTKRNLDTGEETEIVKVAPTRTGYDLSPDGREVVFQMDHAVKTIPINGGEPRELFRSLAKNTDRWWEYDLKWTRDGRFIIARSSTQQEDHHQIYMSGKEIWRIPVLGGTPLKLDLSVPEMVSFALHPDSHHFAFSVYEGTREELWVLENFLPK